MLLLSICGWGNPEHPHGENFQISDISQSGYELKYIQNFTKKIWMLQVAASPISESLLEKCFKSR